MNLSAITKVTNAIVRNRKTIAKMLFFAGAVLEGIPSIFEESQQAAKSSARKKKRSPREAEPSLRK